MSPAWSRGQWDYNGTFTDIPGNNSSTNGIAQFLLPPEAAPEEVGRAHEPGRERLLLGVRQGELDIRSRARPVAQAFARLGAEEVHLSLVGVDFDRRREVATGRV